ncbi:MAG: transcription antitermination factor NusB, partial [Phycisphaerales bacterium JB041]
VECSQYPDFGLDPLDDAGLSDRDAALAHAIYDAAVRRGITISRLAGGFLKQPWHGLEANVQAPLLAGAAQFLFLDRIPTHAAIDETVEWTKHASGRGSAGLVNAVLRRIAGLISRDTEGNAQFRPTWQNARDELPLADGRSLVLNGPVLASHELHCASAATGVPIWQIERWADEFGVDDALHIAWHSLTTGPTILCAPAGMPESPATTPHHSESHRVFIGARSALADVLASGPHVWVQDATATSAIELLSGDEASTPLKIVDLCAGRGTKTRQLLEKYPDAEVVACEVSQPRLEDLHRLAQLADGRVRVCRPEQAARELGGACDLVVADVPCSNSGVLARRVEARHRCSERQIKRLNEQQREILGLAHSLLAPGARLLYSTCSLEHAENAAMAGWASRVFGLTLVREHLTLPAGGPGRPASEYHDGGYAAVLHTLSRSGA